MNQIFPGYGPSGHAPTHEEIAALQITGWITNDRIFAGRPDWFTQAGGSGSPWPTAGRAKYWGSPNINRNLEKIYIKRNSDGTYPALKADRSARFNLHGAIFGQSVWNDILTRQIPVPDLELRVSDYAECGRFSFPQFEIEDPMDPPVCEVLNREDALNFTNDFPKNVFLYVWQGAPYWATVGDPVLAERFPVPVIGGTAPMPGSGTATFSADQVVGLAISLMSSSARGAAASILQGGGSMAEKAAALAAIK